ncbi:HAD hydrolase-like protein [Schaalia cardiffensis]|uniref:HAD hydrolase-like protein n=1 Tax=Schaalia cardiffensis TaxID=181487 RepID=UPI0023EF6FB5|nr:HAD hydrolase-like protein [Schaalia cardiffensis]
MSSHSRWTSVLFDVDGTLVDSASVVTKVFGIVLSAKGFPVPEESALMKYVGPPLWWSFTDLGFEGDLVEELVTSYRRTYIEFYLEPLPFPGITELISLLHAAGFPLATATSKQQPMALAQITHLGLEDSFDVVAGATPGRDSTKASVIADALSRLEAQGHDVSRPVLIGDSIWDVEGAALAQIDVIGVSWGYAQPGDLDSCTACVSSPQELAELLGLSEPV